MSILSPLGPLMAPPPPPEALLQRAVSLAWENSTLALPCSSPSLFPANLGRRGWEEGTPVCTSHLRWLKLQKTSLQLEGPLTPLKGVPWPLPQMFIRFLNKPFVPADLSGIPPSTGPMWDHPWVCLNTDLGAPLRRGQGQLLLWISAPSPGAEGLKIFWNI